MQVLDKRDLFLDPRFVRFREGFRRIGVGRVEVFGYLDRVHDAFVIVRGVDDGCENKYNPKIEWNDVSI